MSIARVGIAVAAAGALAIGAMGWIATGHEPSARALDADEPLPDEITPALDASVRRGLRFLAAQQLADGSFTSPYRGRSVAITSLACLAFMADGHLPDRGEYGPIVDRGMRYVVANATESGLIAADVSSGPMYGHGFATLFLGEVYGTTRGGGETAEARRLHEALVDAVRLIERTQNDEGGWRYNPVPEDADVSVTVCQVMALRSARNAGIEVSSEVIDRAVSYVRRCQNPDGGWRYRLNDRISAWPRSAAGIATLYYAGIYEDDQIDRGLRYLENAAMPGTNRAGPRHYWYGQYYAVQAAFLAGGPWWARWWPAVRAELMDRQLPDGGWSDGDIGDPYATSMALIVLQMPKRYLPIYQR